MTAQSTEPFKGNLYPQSYVVSSSLTYQWDVATLEWVKGTQPGASGGGAVTIANGADVAQGSTTDVAWVSGAGTTIALLKTIAAGGAGLTDAQLRATPVPVSGTVVANPTGYITRLEEASATVTYVGSAVPGTATSAASWSIKRLDSASGLIVLWGAGTAAFNQIWDNRAALAYS